MGSFGPNNGATFASDGTVGTIAVTNASNAGASDNSYATLVLLLGESGQYLKATGFSFAIPLDATIAGILVEIERSTTVLNSVTDLSVKLVKAGAIVGSEKAAAGQWPTSDAYASYGDAASDLWGTTWTPAEINASTFGVVVSPTAALAATAQIDHVRVTIGYTGSNRPGALTSRLIVGSGMSTAESLK